MFISGLLPSRLIIGLVETSRIIGDINKSPFVFKAHGLTNVTIQVNGDSTETYNQELCFNDNGPRYIEAYDHMFKALGCSHSPCTIDLTAEEFKDNKFLMIYDITPPGEMNTLPRYGNIKIELKFRVPTDKNLTVLCYTETQAVLNIDHVKSIYYKDFTQVGK